MNTRSLLALSFQFVLFSYTGTCQAGAVILMHAHAWLAWQPDAMKESPDQHRATTNHLHAHLKSAQTTRIDVLQALTQPINRSGSRRDRSLQSGGLRPEVLWVLHVCQK